MCKAKEIKSFWIENAFKKLILKENTKNPTYEINLGLNGLIRDNEEY